MKDGQLTRLWTILGVGLLLAGCSSGTASTPSPTADTSKDGAPGAVIAEGRLEPIRFAEMALNASGLVGEVLLKEGDKVTAGQLIASLENGEAKTLESAQADALQKVTKAYERVRDSQYELDIFEVPPEFSGLTPTQAVETNLEKLNVARTDFEPYKYVEVKQLELTPAEKDEPVLRSTPKRLKKALDDAWTKYRKAIQWLDRESALQDAKAQLAQAQQDYDSLHDTSFAENSAGLRAALANAEVRAPFGGIITNLDLKVGEFAASGKPVVTVADLSSWVVKTTDLTEIDVVNLKEGRPVTVTLDALTNVTLKGYILTIAQNYSLKQGDIVYEVAVLLTDKHPAMRWGMTAQVSFPR